MTYKIERTGDAKRIDGMRGNLRIGITPVDAIRMAYLNKTTDNLPYRTGSPWGSRITAVDSLRMSY